MSSHTDTIKERLSIVEVISQYIKLDPAGSNYKACCPFHNEKTPSFFVSPVRNSYYCFGCGAKGDIFSFVEHFEGTDFRGALKLLAERAGVTLDVSYDASKENTSHLFSVMQEAATLYTKKLEANTLAEQYLKTRGLSAETIASWKIGYAPAEWHFISDSLRTVSQQVLLDAGLIKQGEKGVYDRFRGRIMFPIHDTSGRIVAFSGRAFDNPDDEAKYLNSPETAIFNKSQVLYGLDKAKQSIRQKDYVILVEGQFDLIMAHQAGFQNTVATSGTALTEGHLRLIKRFTNRIMVAYDADGAGWRASKRAWELALSLGMEVKIAHMPHGKDPADCILDNKQLFVDALRGAQHIIDGAVQKIVSETSDPRERGKRAYTEVLPYIKSVESAIDQAHYVKKTALDLGISEDAIWKDLSRVDSALPRGKEDTFIAPSKHFSLEKSLYGLLLWQEAINPSRALHIKNELNRIKTPEYVHTRMLFYKETQEDVVFEAEVSYGGNEETIEKALAELLREYEIADLKDIFTEKMKQITIAEKTGDTSRAEMLLLECQGISKKMHDLKTQK